MPSIFAAPPNPTGENATRSALCVLASGSRGNCSALVTAHADGSRDVVLFDLGISPRRTRNLLAELGASIDDVRAAVVTHLDSDHCHSGWAKARGDAFPLYVHQGHLGRAERAGFIYSRADRFRDDEFEPCPGVRISATLMSHDTLGVAAFRIALPCGAALGYATDLGHATQGLAEHLAGVDVLAIESNYCPYLQKTSQRPAWLKQRIMGGAGHLSNAQSAELVRAIAPRRRVVLLHLSQECNRPEVALRTHDTDSFDVIVSSQHEPTEWIEIDRAETRRDAPAVVLPTPRQQVLFGSA